MLEYDSDEERLEIEEEENEGIYREKYLGEKDIDILSIIDKIILELPKNYKITPTENFKDILEDCLLYSNYAMFEQFDDFSYFDNFLKSVHDLNFKENNYILIPGDSPTYFVYAFRKVYPNFKNIIEFPISKIEKYNEENRQSLFEKISKLEDILKDIYNLDKYEILKESLDKYNKLSILLRDFDKNRDNQNRVVEKYMKIVLKNVPKNAKFIYVDFITGGRLIKQLEVTLDILGFNGIIKRYPLESHIIYADCRCAPYFPPNKIEEFVKNNNPNINQIEHNYLKCNIILYIYGEYLKDKNRVLDTIKYIKENFKKYTYKKINLFKNKYISIKYIEITGEYEGSQTKIVFLDNVLLENVYYGYLKLSGNIIKIYEKSILNIEEL